MTTEAGVNTNPRFEGDDATTIFPFEYSVTSASDVHLYVALDGALVSTEIDPADFTLNLDADFVGGTITYPTVLSGNDPLTTVDALSIPRETEYVQPDEFKNQKRIPSENLEKALDNLGRQVADLAEDSERSVKVDVTSEEDPEDLLEDINDAVTASAASAAAAAVSETNAGVSETNAGISAAAAAASAAGVDLPSAVAETWLYQPVGAAGYVLKTSAEAATLLGVDANTTNIGTNTTNIATNVTDIGDNTTDIGTNTSAIALNTAKGTRTVLFTGSAGVSTINLSEDMDNFNTLIFEVSKTGGSGNPVVYTFVPVVDLKLSDTNTPIISPASSSLTTVDCIFHYATDTSITIKSVAETTLTKVVGIK